MVFQFLDKKAIVTEQRLSLYEGENLIFEQETSRLLMSSETRPFELEGQQGNVVSSSEDAGALLLVFSNGRVQATLRFAASAQSLMIQASFVNGTSEQLRDYTAGLTLFCTGHGKNKVTIPHMIYNDNPSADPERIVPHIGEVVGEGVIVEEHRLPIPAVNVEWGTGENSRYVTLLSRPDVVTGDQSEYWSLGAVKEEDGERITALSGPLMFNGMKDVVYGGRCTPLPYLTGYRYVRPQEGLTKTFFLAWGLTEEGKGFRNMVSLGYHVLKPRTERQHTHEQMIEYKKQVLDTRFYEDEHCCGYLTFGAANHFGNISRRPEYFLYAWTGQALKLAWCDAVLGLKTEETFRLERAVKVADFFVQGAQSPKQPGLFQGYYLIEKQEWRNVWKDPSAPASSRIEGESLVDLIDLMSLLKRHNHSIPSHWEEAVQNACEFLMSEQALTDEGIYPMNWNMDGTVSDQMTNAAGMPCVLALAKAGEYFANPSYLAYAVRRYEVYYNLHMRTFERPFARATMDARCEDKESGIYFFTTAAELYRMTREERFKKWASIAADWILTFVFFWETGFQRGTPCYEMNFKTTGWPGVSVQNHHLDVFFPSYEMYAFGVDSQQPFYEEMGQHVSAALTYGVSTREGEYDYSIVGEQGEHYYHTNYFQIKYPVILKCLCCYRGGMQVWNPSWITAQVMQSAIRYYYEL